MTHRYLALEQPELHSAFCIVDTTLGGIFARWVAHAGYVAIEYSRDQ